MAIATLADGACSQDVICKLIQSQLEYYILYAVLAENLQSLDMYYCSAFCTPWHANGVFVPVQILSLVGHF